MQGQKIGHRAAGVSILLYILLDHGYFFLYYCKLSFSLFQNWYITYTGAQIGIGNPLKCRIECELDRGVEGGGGCPFSMALNLTFAEVFIYLYANIQ